jgi:hypothetical protein
MQPRAVVPLVSLVPLPERWVPSEPLELDTFRWQKWHSASCTRLDGWPSLCHCGKLTPPVRRVGQRWRATRAPAQGRCTGQGGELCLVVLQHCTV